MASDYEAAVEVRDAVMSVAWELASIKDAILIGDERIVVLSENVRWLTEAVKNVTAELVVLGELFSTAR